MLAKQPDTALHSLEKRTAYAGFRAFASDPQSQQKTFIAVTLRKAR
jgi:hypothetical protein